MVNKLEPHIKAIRKAAMETSSDESERALMDAANFFEKIEKRLKLETIGDSTTQFNRGRIWLANKILGVTRQ